MKITVEAGQSERQYWADLWRYRELFFFLAWRDLLVRYKQTIIGISWAVLRPLMTMLVLTVVFGKIAKMPSGGVPYPLLVFAAMLPWHFFATSFAEAGNSLVGNSNMISKVYFPRMTIPVSVVMVSFVDMLISLLLLVLLMAWFGFKPPAQVVMLPVFMLIAVIISTGAGLWVAALNVKYRDFRYIIPFVVQFGLYVSPVGFSSSAIPDGWRLMYSLNPMVGVIDGFRWAILGGQHQIYWPGFLLSNLVIIFVFISGVAYFRKTEKHFADVI